MICYFVTWDTMSIELEGIKIRFIKIRFLNYRELSLARLRFFSLKLYHGSYTESTQRYEIGLLRTMQV